MYQEINNKMREYEEELKSTMAKFRHAIGAFEDVISFLNNSIKYNMHVHMDGNRMLLVDVYDKNHNKILDMIKKERPRLIVYSIEIKDDRCVFNISYDTNWKKEPKYVQTSVYTDELPAKGVKMINEKWYCSISDRNLRTCYDEIMDFYSTGVLPHKSLTRQLFRKFIEENPQLKSLESNPEQACKYILEEMARRYRYLKVEVK